MNRTEREKRGRLMKRKIQKEKIVCQVFLLKKEKMTLDTLLHSIESERQHTEAKLTGVDVENLSGVVTPLQNYPAAD